MKVIRKLAGLLSALLLTAGALRAQNLPGGNFYAYGVFGTALSNLSTTHIGAEMVLFRQHQIHVGYARFLRKSPDTPDDYVPNTFFTQDFYPQDFLDGLTLGYHYVFYPKRRGDIFRFSAGPSVVLGTYSTPVNFHRVSGWGSNYGYDDREEGASSLLLEATAAYVPAQAIGFRLGVFGLLGKLPGGGARVSLLLGKVGSRHRKAR